MNVEQDVAELLAEVRRIEVHSTRLVRGVMAGSYRSVFRGTGIEFDEVREYQEGDDPRTVDWNVTARVGKPYVKKYVDERERTVVFAVDLSSSMDGGYGPHSARWTAARICGCLALTAAQNADRVGLIAFDDRVVHFVPPRKGRAHAVRIVRDCLALPSSGRRTDLVPALEFASRMLRRHAVLFVVSDFLASGYRRTLAACARRHDLVAVRLTAPEVDEGGILAKAGMVRLSDPESGRRRVVDWGSRRVRRQYEQRVVEWRARQNREFVQSRVDRVDVPLAREAGGQDVVARALLGFFRARETRSLPR